MAVTGAAARTEVIWQSNGGYSVSSCGMPYGPANAVASSMESDTLQP